MLNQIANTKIAALPSYTKIPVQTSLDFGSAEKSENSDKLSKAQILSQSLENSHIHQVMD